MTYEQLLEALDQHGGDLARWPDDLRADAQALATTSDEAARAIAAAGALERNLTAAVTPLPVDAAFMGRIMADLDHHAPHHEMALRPTARLFAWAGAAMVAFLVTGFAAGLVVPQSQSDDTLAGLMFGSAFVSETDSGGVL